MNDHQTSNCIMCAQSKWVALGLGSGSTALGSVLLTAPKLIAQHRQQGIALLMVLMFLLVVTGISLYSARYAMVGETASRNQMSNELARQAAEAALRDGERDVLLLAKPAAANCTRAAYGTDRFVVFEFTAQCPLGQCAPASFTGRDWENSTSVSPLNPEPWWPENKGGQWNTSGTKTIDGSVPCSFNGSVPLGAFTGTAALVGVARQPDYLLELMERGDSRFVRITGRGFGLSEQTQVVLQSYVEISF